MRIIAFLAFCGLALFCGCSSEHYVQGRSDAGQFILQHALAYGGRPVTTNSLPTIGGDWQYVQDEFGVGILLPASQYQSARYFLHTAFGPPSSKAGWAARDFGVAIYFGQYGSNTEISVLRPMSDEQMARAAKKMDKIVRKSTK